MEFDKFNSQRPSDAPRIVIIAGPNGAGKSTAARSILTGPFAIDEFVNADTIAQGLSGFAPESVAIESGRVMLARIKDLAARRRSFAFETTLASRSFAPWLSRLIVSGYEFNLVYLWIPSPEMAISRVAERVRRGGHAVPEATIRRRYKAGVANFFDLYQPLSTVWRVMHNGLKNPYLVAEGNRTNTHAVGDSFAWNSMLSFSKHGPH